VVKGHAYNAPSAGWEALLLPISHSKPRHKRAPLFV
jgi:hypothetical protein